MLEEATSHLIKTLRTSTGNQRFTDCILAKCREILLQLIHTMPGKRRAGELSSPSLSPTPSVFCSAAHPTSLTCYSTAPRTNQRTWFLSLCLRYPYYLPPLTALVEESAQQTAKANFGFRVRSPFYSFITSQTEQETLSH